MNSEREFLKRQYQTVLSRVIRKVRTINMPAELASAAFKTLAEQMLHSNLKNIAVASDMAKELSTNLSINFSETGNPFEASITLGQICSSECHEINRSLNTKLDLILTQSILLMAISLYASYKISNNSLLDFKGN